MCDDCEAALGRQRCTGLNERAAKVGEAMSNVTTEDIAQAVRKSRDEDAA